MKRDLNCFDPNATEMCIFLRAVFRFRFIACNQIQTSSERFIFLRLSTLPRSDFSGCHGAKKHHRLVLFWARALQKFNFLMFSFIAYGNLATSPKRLEIELTNIRRRHFCSLPVFCIEHSFIYFLLGIFFIICLFWHTLIARDDTHTRQHTRQGRK